MRIITTLLALLAFATAAVAQIAQPPVVSPLVAVVNTGTALNSNQLSATAYAIPAGKGGVYRISIYAAETVADAATSTLPNVGVGWSDNDTNVALQATTVTPTNTSNAVGAFAQAVQTINARAGTNITWLTSNYASGTAGVMNYAVRIRIEYLN